MPYLKLTRDKTKDVTDPKAFTAVDRRTGEPLASKATRKPRQPRKGSKRRPGGRQPWEGQAVLDPAMSGRAVRRA